MEEERKYTITEYCIEKAMLQIAQDLITPIKNEINSIENKISELTKQKNKMEEYEAFCEDFLRRNSLQIKTWEEEK